MGMSPSDVPSPEPRRLERMTSSDSSSEPGPGLSRVGPPTYPGTTLVTAGAYAWRLLAVGAVGYYAVKFLSQVSLVVIPFIVSLLVAAVLRPLFDLLRRRGVGRGPATILTMLSAVVVLGGLITVVVIRAAQEAPQLGDEINGLIPQVKNWLITGPLKLDATTVNNLGNTITSTISKNSSAVASAALTTGKTAVEVLGGIALTIFSSVFLVYDGDRVWSFLVKGFPLASRQYADAGARAAWTTISYYVRGTLVVATFHGVVVGITLTILGVPLAFPLAVLVALGAFVPLLGAFVTGVLAVGVAGLSHGLFAAIVVLAVLVADNQIEAHVLQPFVVGRYVRIHPLAVVLSLGVGGILFGIFGAIVAVPVVACINSAIRAMRGLHGHPSLEGDDIPPGGG